VYFRLQTFHNISEVTFVLKYICSVIDQHILSFHSVTFKLKYVIFPTSNLPSMYSGDHDAIIPFLGTESWVRSLNYPILDEWRGWHLDGQSAGYGFV
jgi:hypothetical protein